MANEESPEPTLIDFAGDAAGRRPGERIGERRQINLVGNGEMFEALADAPPFRRRLPIELFERQRRREGDRARVAGLQLRQQAPAPGR